MNNFLLFVENFDMFFYVYLIFATVGDYLQF